MKKLISYVFPIYNETGNVDLLYQTVASLLDEHTKYNYELVFVNDGSTDDSLEKLIALHSKDNRVCIINFARNFGQQIAVTAGLDYAKGDAVIIMDSDLQDPPKVSFELIQKWEEGYDVVYAQRRSRKDSFLKKLTADLFYRTLHTLADIDIPRNTGDFRLLDRKVATELNRFREHNRFLRGMISYVGFKQTAVLFDRDARHSGTTHYPLKKLLHLAGDGIFGFSTFPLRLISKLGYFISVLSFLGIIYALSIKLFDEKLVVPGWTFTIIAVLLVSGVQLIMLGVLGSYIGRIYAEVQQRPLYWVESVRNHTEVR